MGGVLEGVGFEELGVVLEADVGPAASDACVLGLEFARVGRAQTIADIGRALGEPGVFLDEVLIDGTALDDVVGDVVEDHQVGLGVEHHGNVGQVEAAVLEGGHHRDLDVRRTEPAIGDAGPEHRVHLGHVRAPEHEGVGGLDVVVAAHGFVHAEGAHEAHGR